MKFRGKITLSIVQITIVTALIYGTISLVLLPFPSTYPSATKFTEVLSKLFLLNRSRDGVRNSTSVRSLAVNIDKSLNDSQRNMNKTDRHDLGCLNFQPNEGYDFSSLPFRCSHLMTLAGSRGRTGNQMFQFAALLGIAHRHNYTPFVKPNFPLLRYFDIPQVKDLNMSAIVRLGEVKSGVYSTAVGDINVSNNYSLDGYFQSWRYFSNISDIIRTSFKIKQTFLNEATAFMKHISVPGKSKVCVHVRRGDVYSKPAAKQGYSVGGLDFIIRAMNYFRIHVKHVQFIAVSEDKQWCRLHLNRNDTVVSPFHLIPVDFAILTLCDHVIITAGTFGWWGGWFSSGTVIYYRDFPRPNSWLATQVNKEDYYPPHWIPMI